MHLIFEEHIDSKNQMQTRQMCLLLQGAYILETETEHKQIAKWDLDVWADKVSPRCWYLSWDMELEKESAERSGGRASMVESEKGAKALNCE